MKILCTSIGVPGHLNPILAAANILSRHHEVAVQTSNELQSAVENAGLRFLQELPGSRSFFMHVFTDFPEAITMPHGLEKHAWLFKHLLADRIPMHAANLQYALQQFPADVIVADSFYFGTLPLLLGPRAKRPAIVHLGISVLNVHSGKDVPQRPGVSAEKARHERLLYERIVLQPTQAAVDRSLATLGLGPLPCPAMESLSTLSDSYIHPGIESFEYPSSSPTVHFIGRLPLAKEQTPLPEWWDKLDRTKRLVLVTQGTISNRDLGQLVGPTLTGLAGEEDLIVLVTTGGAPVDSIPVEIPANAYVTEFLPYDQVLPNIDLLISNGGYGTVNMALANGVPLVTAGLTEDKEEVSAHVQWAGVGIDLHTIQPDPEAVRRAAREVLDRDQYRTRATQMAREFANCNPEKSLLQRIEEAARGNTKAS